MISDAKLQLILTLYKNDKLTFEEVKTLIQEDTRVDKFVDPIQSRSWINPYPWGTYVGTGLTKTQ